MILYVMHMVEMGLTNESGRGKPGKRREEGV